MAARKCFRGDPVNSSVNEADMTRPPLIRCDVGAVIEHADCDCHRSVCLTTASSTAFIEG